VFDHRRSERVSSVFEDPEIDQESARRLGIPSGMWGPLIVRDRAVGVSAVHDKLSRDPSFTD
jgi:signal transduction histidine kinase